jgi:predicted phosphodiesterase
MDKGILQEAGKIFEKEHRLIELPYEGRVVLMGDTHGDFEATDTVLNRYLPHKENTLVFLGDYVDRGPKSRENIDLLLRRKADNPERVYLLMGNHEGYKILKWSPKDFWLSLSPEEREAYEDALAKLPLAASGNGVIALHGGLPDVPSAEAISSIKAGSQEWLFITGGDFESTDRDYLGISESGRPAFGKKYFNRVMRKLGKNVLIRSHQPDAAGIMYNNRCLTLFTSHAYLPRRTIAIADLGKETKSVNDLRIEGV